VTFFCLLLLLLLYKCSGVHSLIISCWVFFLVKFLESPYLLQCKGLGKCSHYNDLLWAGQSRDWIPVGARFSILFQTGLGAYPVSCAMGTSCLLGVKRPGHGIDSPNEHLFFLKDISSLKNFLLLHSVILHKYLFNVTWIVHTMNASYTRIVLLINQFLFKEFLILCNLKMVSDKVILY
jgi:hypothetical protein